MTDSTDDAVSGSSNATVLDDAGPGTSKEKTDPSNATDSEEGLSRKMKRVTFSRESIPSIKQSWTPLQKRRQSSIIGSAGFVAQLVDELEEEEFEVPLEEEEIKPIRKQSIDERRKSIKDVEADIGYYMKSVARMSISGATPSLDKLPVLSEEQVKTPSESKISDLEKCPSSVWLPSEILESKARVKIEQSWVGTYIVGKDYWNEEEDDSEAEDRKAMYATEEKKPWFELPVKEEETALLKLKTKSIKKIDALKDQMDKEFLLKRKERLISAAHAREKPKFFEEWTDNFKMIFKEVAKKNECSHYGTHISMANTDKWLEDADILDHVKLTLLHTGFFFVASGGSRNRGLSFTEFTHFLEMVSYATKMPLRDITKRLEVCLRKISTFKDA